MAALVRNQNQIGEEKYEPLYIDGPMAPKVNEYDFDVFPYHYQLKCDPDGKKYAGEIIANINYKELIESANCCTGENAIKLIRDKMGWGNNYYGGNSPLLFNIHAINFIQRYKGFEYDFVIFFFTLKKNINTIQVDGKTLLVDQAITTDPSLINIIRRAHQFINLHSFSDYAEEYHNYNLQILTEKITKNTNRIKQNPEVIEFLRSVISKITRTEPWPSQINSVDKMLKIEHEPFMVELTTDKVFPVSSCPPKYLNYDALGRKLASDDEKRENFTDYVLTQYPKSQVFGGITCDPPSFGKTLMMLILAFYPRPTKSMTLIIANNEITKNDIWLKQINEHIIAKNKSDVTIITYDEAVAMLKANSKAFEKFERLIIDEIHELYCKNIYDKDENPREYERKRELENLFDTLCVMKNFKFRWGMTATPFVDCGKDHNAVYKLLEFVLGRKILYRQLCYSIKAHDALSNVLFRHDIFNGGEMIKLPDMEIYNIPVEFSETERQIYDASKLHSGTSVEELLKLCCNAVMTISNQNLTSMTVEEVKKCTVIHFENKVREETKIYNSLKANIDTMNKALMDASSILQTTQNKQNIQFHIDELKKQIAITEAQAREQELNITSRKNVLERYKQMISVFEAVTQQDRNAFAAANENENEITDVTKEDILCAICYNNFTSIIILYNKCNHFCCEKCYQMMTSTMQMTPNNCPVCRTDHKSNDIIYVNNDVKVLGAKNIEIIKIIKSSKRYDARPERFVIFTQFNKFMEPLLRMLNVNNIPAKSFDEFYKSSDEEKENTQAIVLSSSNNASGIDLSFINKLIIVEPFDDCVNGREIETQIIGRIRRVNQTEKVYVYRLYIKDTIEEEIYAGRH
jgi:SNF2 family DNA or RNA helicase